MKLGTMVVRPNTGVNYGESAVRRGPPTGQWPTACAAAPSTPALLAPSTPRAIDGPGGSPRGCRRQGSILDTASQLGRVLEPAPAQQDPGD